MATTYNLLPNNSFEELFLEIIQAVWGVGTKKEKQSKMNFIGKVRMTEVLKGKNE